MEDFSDEEFDASLIGSDTAFSPVKLSESETESDDVAIPPPKRMRIENRKQQIQKKVSSKKGDNVPKKKKETTRKSERPRKKTNRFGARESTANFNSFFEKLAAQESAKEKSAAEKSTHRKTNETNIDRNHTNVDSIQTNGTNGTMNFESANSELLVNAVVETESKFDELQKMLSELSQSIKSIDTKFDVEFSMLQRQVARVEVKLNNRRQSSDSDNFNFETEYLSELKKMGFPLKDVDGLIEVENKLKDANYENHLVSIQFVNILFLR